MKLRDSILNYSFKRQRWIEMFSIFFIFLGVSFKFTSNETKWIWASYPYIAILIAGFSLLFIELSTLKTHINKIYKTLNIKSRKDVRKYK